MSRDLRPKPPADVAAGRPAADVMTGDQGHAGRTTENKFAPFTSAGAARLCGWLDTRRQAFFCIPPEGSITGSSPPNCGPNSTLAFALHDVDS